MYYYYSATPAPDEVIFSNVLSGIGGFIGLIAVFIFFIVFSYSIRSKVAAHKAAIQEQFARNARANATTPEKAVFIPQVEGIGSTEGKGSSVRMTPEPVAQEPKPQDRTRPRPEPKPAPPSGSMGFQSTEGVGTSAYQSPVPAQIADSQYKNIDRKLPADKLRAAIVMSEILAKPVSLRKRDARIGR